MSDTSINIKIAAQESQATTALDSVASKITNLKTASATASGGMGNLVTSIRGVSTAMRGLTTLFGLTGAIGGVFMLISMVQRLYDVWKKFTASAADPAQQIAVSSDAATKAVKQLADEYDNLAAARARAAKADAALDQAHIAATTAKLAAEAASEADPAKRAAMQEGDAAFLARRQTEAGVRSAQSSSSLAQANLTDTQSQIAELRRRLARLQKTTFFGGTRQARGQAAANIPVIEQAIAKLESSLPDLAAAVAIAAANLEAAETRHGTTLQNIRNLEGAREQERIDARKKEYDDQYEADVTAAEKAYNIAQAKKKRQADHDAAIADAERTRDEKIAAITVDAPRAASAAAQTGGITGGMLNNTQRLADQRAAKAEAIAQEHTRILNEINAKLGE